MTPLLQEQIPLTTGTSLFQAARLTQERNVRRLLVVDDRGLIAGIVSHSDLLQVFLRSDEDLREEIVGTLVPALLRPVPAGLAVNVHWNVVTLSGELDRKSDAEILTRLAKDLDGVVSVVNELSYRWDDTAPNSAEAAPVVRSFLGRDS